MSDTVRANSLLPIGVFDSGVGGLSVLRHLRAMLPMEDFFYVADSAHAPYGVRDEAFIRGRAMAILAFLRLRGIKALVVACNTATAAAIAELRQHCAFPVIAMEPGIKPAVEVSRSKVIGVLATAGTLESARFFALLNRYAVDAEVITQPCPGLVEAIEANQIESAATQRLLRAYLDPLLARGADTLVLGCTHYPFVREQIAALVGPDIAIIETGAPVAREVKRRLQLTQLAKNTADAHGRPIPGRETFWSSGDPAAVQRVISALWRPDSTVLPLV